MVVLEGYQDLLILVLALPRMLAVFAMIPAFSATVLPGSTQRAIALSFTLILQPVVAGSIDPETLTPTVIALIAAKEVVIGLI
ncbi:MAG: flagellar biosynthetic protein FliR, partial [Pseudomonadota bacterium]